MIQNLNKISDKAGLKMNTDKTKIGENINIQTNSDVVESNYIKKRYEII